MATYEFPLTTGPQAFSLRLGDTEYRLRLTYRRAPEAGWILDIGRAADGVPLLSGLPLVTGADLLAQHAHIGIPGSLYVVTDGNPDAVPAFDDLGGRTRLLFVDAT
ncbi:phage baseplate plug family protein [Salinarimonas soli]|uniref:Cyanophage baseplate Pam3 plug gp18 domain-containing protein n=1 Tax=Salinarimonas soli TaxID=1638099 RepID=A0A5B2VGI1_9HYPH|nr:hypothetical protein [Salinarimonas soli]KAA2237666.1 hypothetical protein F0L46_08270 [Salinarimonas soli]